MNWLECLGVVRGTCSSSTPLVGKGVYCGVNVIIVIDTCYTSMRRLFVSPCSDRHLLSSTRMFCEIMGCVVAYKCIIQSNTVAKSIVSRRCEDPIFILVKKKT